MREQLAALAVIRDAGDRVLFVRHAYADRLWALRGGGLDPGESPQRAVAREVMEEVGLVVEASALVGVYTLVPEPIGFRFVFDCTTTGDPRITDLQEISDLAWFATDALPRRTYPSVPFAVRDAIAGLRGVVREVAHVGPT